jgi:hypothetical protein
MDARRAVLRPVHMQPVMGEIDGIPPKPNKLRRPKAVPIRDQHRGGVALASYGSVCKRGKHRCHKQSYDCDGTRVRPDSRITFEGAGISAAARMLVT